MEKIQKTILILILIFIIIISLILVYLFTNSNNKTKKINSIVNNTDILNELTMPENNNGEEGGDIGLTEVVYKEDYKIYYVQDRIKYFTINNIVNNYINLIGYENKENLKAILSPQYINKYGITDANIFTKLTVQKPESNKQYYKTNVTDMLTAKIDETTYAYIVKGNCRISGVNSTFPIQAMIVLDTTNKSYNLYPYQYLKDNGFNKLKVGDEFTKYNKEDITDREYNKYSYVKSKTDKEMANNYFDNIKELLIYYPDEAYNKLDADYSKKRFGSKEAFNTYLEDNKSNIYSMQINEYKVVSTDNYTDYICTDKYNNFYIFRQQGGVMRYNVFLDNYNIMRNEDLKQYNGFTDKLDKAKYQVETFIEKVNTKDYSSIYNSLNETFKNNNYKTQEDLKKYLQDNLYNINSIEIINYDNTTYDYCVFECKITNLKNTKETKEISLIIDIKEGTEFKLSFSVNK